MSIAAVSCRRSCGGASERSRSSGYCTRCCSRIQPRALRSATTTVRSSPRSCVRNYLQEREVAQKFTHVATPEENCFIEAYHSILDKQLLQTTEFNDIEEAIAVFSRWRTFYNERRRHGSLDQQPTKKVWDAFERNNFGTSGEADAGNAGEQPARNSLMNGEEKREEPALASSSPLNSSLFPCLQKPKNSLSVLKNLCSY
jgi:hypothetical protein